MTEDIKNDNMEHTSKRRSYFSFSGRSKRSDRWEKRIFIGGPLAVVAWFLLRLVGDNEGTVRENAAFVVSIIGLLVLLIRQLILFPVDVRRCHDLDHPWWVACLFSVIELVDFFFTEFGWGSTVIILLFYGIIPGSKGTNSYGESDINKG